MKWMIKLPCFLGDFAENYKFITQDEVQSFHWTNLQCTLHPVVVYYKENDKLCLKSFCVLSDDMTHDVCMVYEVQRSVINEIKEMLPLVSKIEYFSDGCAGQYKNRNNFKNLSLHKQDFGLDAEWVFFTTSHGKSPCDGIGGTVKRATAKTSLQRPIGNQILDTEKMYEFCLSNFENIKFILVTSQLMENTRKELSARFVDLSTIPGTRSFHHFVPVSENQIKYETIK